jgi:hypothetical protein
MLAARKLSPQGLCCKAATPLRPRRAVAARAAVPESPKSSSSRAEKDSLKISPVTGNPQTGKLIDVYFEVATILVVVVVSFWSLWNVKDVLTQTGSADSLRQPAAKTEWLAMDNKDVRSPCCLLCIRFIPSCRSRHLQVGPSSVHHDSQRWSLCADGPALFPACASWSPSCFSTAYALYCAYLRPTFNPGACITSSHAETQ